MLSILTLAVLFRIQRGDKNKQVLPPNSSLIKGGKEGLNWKKLSSAMNFYSRVKFENQTDKDFLFKIKKSIVKLLIKIIEYL